MTRETINIDDKIITLLNIIKARMVLDNGMVTTKRQRVNALLLIGIKRFTEGGLAFNFDSDDFIEGLGKELKEMKFTKDMEQLFQYLEEEKQ